MSVEPNYSNPMLEIPQAGVVQIIHDRLTKSSGRHEAASQCRPVAQYGSLNTTGCAHHTTAWDVPNTK